MEKSIKIKPRSKRVGNKIIFPPDFIEIPDTKKKPKKKKFQYF